MHGEQNLARIATHIYVWKRTFSKRGTRRWVSMGYGVCRVYVPPIALAPLPNTGAHCRRWCASHRIAVGTSPNTESHLFNIVVLSHLNKSFNFIFAPFSPSPCSARHFSLFLMSWLWSQLFHIKYEMWPVAFPFAQSIRPKRASTPPHVFKWILALAAFCSPFLRPKWPWCVICATLCVLNRVLVGVMIFLFVVFVIYHNLLARRRLCVASATHCPKGGRPSPLLLLPSLPPEMKTLQIADCT